MTDHPTTLTQPCHKCYRRWFYRTMHARDEDRDAAYIEIAATCDHSRYVKQGLGPHHRRRFAKEYGCVRGEWIELRCASCGRVGGLTWSADNRIYMTGEMTIDHIIPERHGGSHDTSNLQPMCAGCNTRKGSTI